MYGRFQGPTPAKPVQSRGAPGFGRRPFSLDLEPMTNRRFPPPWTVERLPGGFKVIDANGQSLAYFYARENDNDTGTAGVLTIDEARRLASNFAKLPALLGKES